MDKNNKTEVQEIQSQKEILDELYVKSAKILEELVALFTSMIVSSLYIIATIYLMVTGWLDRPTEEVVVYILSAIVLMRCLPIAVKKAVAGLWYQRKKKRLDKHYNNLK